MKKQPISIEEAKTVVQSAEFNWPFRRLTLEEVRKLEQANRIINQQELHSNESLL